MFDLDGLNKIYGGNVYRRLDKNNKEISDERLTAIATFAKHNSINATSDKFDIPPQLVSQYKHRAKKKTGTGLESKPERLCEDVPNTEHDGSPTMPKPGSDGTSISDNPQGQNKTREPAGIHPSPNVADTKSQRVQRLRSGWEQVTPTHEKQEVFMCDSETGRFSHWETEPGICRVVDGLPYELDLLRRLDNEKEYAEKTNTEIDRIKWKVLRTMWQHKELATTSPELYLDRLSDCLSDMPCENTHGRW